jgi:predicted GTPase
LSYYPGETNLRISHLLIANKVDTADPVKVEQVIATCREANPDARVIKCRSVITVDEPELIAGKRALPELIAGKRALVVEDGPTLTHGGMEFGAGWFAAKQAGAAEIVDARPHAVGTIKDTYDKYPNAARILPAMGYGDEQVKDLEDTINATDADVVVEGTPIDLNRIITINKPIANIRYELEEVEPGVIEEMVAKAIGNG